MNRRDLSAFLLFIGGLLVTGALWFLAFAGSPGSGASWLIRTQAACFGSAPDGLPGGGGWAILIFSPLAFFSALVAVFPLELKRGFSFLFSRTVGKVSLLLLVALLVAEGTWASAKIKNGLSIRNAPQASSQEPFPEHYPRLSQKAPDFTLINVRGEKISLSAQRGKPVVLTFAFAHCKTLCPAIMRQVTEALKKPTKGEIGIVITLDPWRDTPASLLAFSGEWASENRMEILSGETKDVLRTLAAYEVPMERSPTSGDITHPPVVLVIDKEGQIAFRFNRPDAHWIREAIERI